MFLPYHGPSRFALGFPHVPDFFDNALPYPFPWLFWKMAHTSPYPLSSVSSTTSHVAGEVVYVSVGCIDETVSSNNCFYFFDSPSPFSPALYFSPFTSAVPLGKARFPPPPSLPLRVFLILRSVRSSFRSALGSKKVRCAVPPVHFFFSPTA